MEKPERWAPCVKCNRIIDFLHDRHKEDVTTVDGEPVYKYRHLEHCELPKPRATRQEISYLRT